MYKIFVISYLYIYIYIKSERERLKMIALVSQTRIPNSRVRWSIGWRIGRVWRHRVRNHPRRPCRPHPDVFVVPEPGRGRRACALRTRSGSRASLEVARLSPDRLASSRRYRRSLGTSRRM